MVTSSLVAPSQSVSNEKMPVAEKTNTEREEVEQVARSLREQGVPEYLANIRAAVQVSQARKAQAADRAAAMASHCFEP